MSTLLQTCFAQSRRVLVAALAAGLAACGGGGDGGPAPPPETVALTEANRDTVAHAVVAGAVGLGGADAVLPTSAALTAQRAFARSVRDGRMRALVVLPPEVTNCNVSGTLTVIADDADNSGSESVGDALTLLFDQCVDSPGEIIDGRAAATLTRLDLDGSGFPTALDFRLVMTALTTASDNHSVRLDGAVLASWAVFSTNAVRVSMKADGPVTARVATPVFSDTVTLQNGFLQLNEGDDVETASTIQGGVHSAEAGGTVSVATQTRFRNVHTDEYPRSGVALITGLSGQLRMTAVSATEVRLELDANDDGTFENVVTVRWDWLI